MTKVVDGINTRNTQNTVSTLWLFHTMGHELWMMALAYGTVGHTGTIRGSNENGNFQQQITESGCIHHYL